MSHTADPTPERGARNPGAPFDPTDVRGATVDEADVHRRVEELEARELDPARAPEELLRAIRCLDLTSLAGDDTPARIRELCATARSPLPGPVRDALGARGREARVAAVCVHHAYLSVAREALAGSPIEVAVVAAGFPSGLSAIECRVEEVRRSVREGADEIDAVIARYRVLEEDWEGLREEVSAFREACGDACLKMILATGELPSLTHVARASRVCLAAGADFLKTSTGMEEVNATYSAGLVMADEIRRHHERTGVAVGLKPAGGIRTAAQALRWLALAREELPGGRPPEPGRFRIGASSLLGVLVRELEHVG